ncbi:MAG: TrpR-like protein [Oscillospiraceae bacterium]|nr:TrpR-like protein [Oscillospiraceae bacterium]
MYKAILTLKTESEVKSFLEDICSMTEIMAMEQRFEVAKLLSEGLIYNAIMEKTGASSAIISRVNRSLQYGAGGYDIVFSRLKEKSEDGE